MEDLKKIRVLIIDDHQLVRDGIKAMLLANQGGKYNFELTEADCSNEGVKQILENKFDVVLLDYQLPDSLGPLTVKKILIQKPRTKILALSSYDECTCVNNMIEAGAYGYALKNISPAELIKAVETIIKGKRYYSKEILERMDEDTGNIMESINKPPVKKLGVSKRQCEVLRLIAIGMTNDAIAKQMNLGKRTIDTHRESLMLKLGANNTATLIKKATELSII